MARGGYRKPESPAPASGPGRLSKRTDGGPGQKLRDLPDAAYGEQQAFRQAQAGAALSSDPGALKLSQGSASANPVPVVPFGAPSQNPDEPVTSGINLGPGPDAASLGLPSQDISDQNLAQLARYLPVLEFQANMPNAMPGLRALVRNIKGALSL